MYRKIVLIIVIFLFFKATADSQQITAQRVLPQEWIKSWLLCGPISLQQPENPYMPNDHLDGFKLRHALGKLGPDALLEPGIINFPIHLRRLFVLLRREAAEEIAAFRPEVNAIGVYGQGRAMKRFAGIGAIQEIDVTLAGTYGQGDVCKVCHMASTSSGGIHQGGTGQGFAV